jgi:hypothetical protein
MVRRLGMPSGRSSLAAHLPSNESVFYANISESLNEGKELMVKAKEARQVVAIIEAALRSAESLSRSGLFSPSRLIASMS